MNSNEQSSEVLVLVLDRNRPILPALWQDERIDRHGIASGTNYR